MKRYFNLTSHVDMCLSHISSSKFAGFSSSGSLFGDFQNFLLIDNLKTIEKKKAIKDYSFYFSLDRSLMSINLTYLS